ncbi:MAG: hypothetical protein U0325_16560 [Polyangiales bacterium]
MRTTRVAERAALAALLAGCRQDPPAEGPTTPREALAEFARCVFDGVPADASPARVEAATRLALRVNRGEFAVRAGRCEDALRVRGGAPACLAPLRARWSGMLPVIQRPGVDAIDLDVAVRRVGEAWTLAQRCP